jgi:hypothetical protein
MSGAEVVAIISAITYIVRHLKAEGLKNKLTRQMNQLQEAYDNDDKRTKHARELLVQLTICKTHLEDGCEGKASDVLDGLLAIGGLLAG